MKFITNSVAIILFIDGKTFRVEKDHENYHKIIEAFQLPLEEQEAAALDILVGKSVPAVISKTEGFDIFDGDTYYKGRILPKVFSDKIISIIKDGLPLGHFVKFWENLEQNPSFHVLHETGFFEFLEYQELPITEDGYFIAYRGVQDDYFSVQGSVKTQVLQGRVNDHGKIYNGIREVIEVARNGVSDNRDVSCHEGSLHIGSLDYALGWGNRVVVVKVNPKDVVSVPHDCSAQKCRVSKFEVIADFNYKIAVSVVDKLGNNTLLSPQPPNKRPEFIQKIATYIANRRQDGYDEITIRQIQNSFSPDWPSKVKIVDALQDLGMIFNVDSGIIKI